MMVVVEVTPAVLKKGGAVDVKIKGKDAIQVQVPQGAASTPWCRIKGLGHPGRNGGDPGDLLVYLRQSKASKGAKGKR
jgi:DnaJ-class molecular chaperone